MLFVLVIGIGLAGVVAAIVGKQTKNGFVLSVGIAFLILVTLFALIEWLLIHCRPPNCI